MVRKIYAVSALVVTLLLTACGGGGGSAPGTTNTAPVSDAGHPQSLMIGSLVTLDGSGSTDADHAPLTYNWTLIEKPAGSTATLSSASTVKPTFTTH